MAVASRHATAYGDETVDFMEKVAQTGAVSLKHAGRSMLVESREDGPAEVEHLPLELEDALGVVAAVAGEDPEARRHWQTAFVDLVRGEHTVPAVDIRDRVDFPQHQQDRAPQRLPRERQGQRAEPQLGDRHRRAHAPRAGRVRVRRQRRGHRHRVVEVLQQIAGR